MFVGAKADEVPAIGVPLASITVGLASVEAAGGVARLVGHSHHPSRATIETRACSIYVERARVQLILKSRRPTLERGCVRIEY
jgi:hypothetical protein